jgi:hypothetical protein
VSRSALEAAPSASIGVGAGLHELADCSNPELKACLAPLLGRRLGADDIRALAAAECFKSKGQDVVRQAADCLPLHAGRDAERGEELVFAYAGSNMWPAQRAVALIYEHVSEEECCRLEGWPLHYPGWGGYRDCAPSEATPNGGALINTPDGKFAHIVGSACRSSGPIIVEEWPCEPPLEARQGLAVMKAPLPPLARNAPNIKRHPSTDCASARH